MDIIEFTEKHLVYNNLTKDGLQYGCVLQDYEKEFLEGLVKNRFTINLASRQMHMSTLMCAFVAYSLLFNKNEAIHYIAPKLEHAKHHLNVIKIILLKFMESTKSDVRFSIETATKISLTNGNIVKASSATMDALCGFTPSKILIDGASYLTDFEYRYSVLLAAIATGGQLHILFGPHGLDFTFRLYTGHNSFVKRKYHYSLNSYYTPELIEDLKRRLDERSWNEEMELQFVNKYVPTKYRVLQFRVDDEINYKILARISALNKTVSEYLRDLILKDIKDEH